MTRDEVIAAALGYADDGWVCAESAFLALADLKGIRSDLVPAVATGFGGGIGYTGNVCGAVSGAVAGLGLWFGRSKPVREERRPYWYARVLLERFEEGGRPAACPEILGLDLSRDGAHDRFHEEEMWDRVCKPVIARAVSLAYDIIAEENA